MTQNDAPAQCGPNYSKKNRPTFDAALHIIGEKVRPLGEERIAVANSSGRRITRMVQAFRDCPPFDVSAMDGFAINAHDLVSGEDRSLKLTIGAPAYAGEAARTSSPGEAIPINTGAPIPKGTGAVLIKEAAKIERGHLHLNEQLPSGMNIRFRGEDAHAGQAMLTVDQVMHPAAIGALSAYGVATVFVRLRPKVALLVSGDELRNGHQEPGDFGIFDANGPMIAAALEASGAMVNCLPPVNDNPEAIRDRLKHIISTDVDMIVTTGGVSAGAHDFLPAVLSSLGAQIHFHGVSMRPGKPVLFGTLPDGRPVFCLPGNPVSALVGTRFFVGRAIRAMVGLDAEKPEATVSVPVHKPDLTLVLKARRRRNGTSTDAPDILPGQQSHMLHPLLQADCWVVSPADGLARVFPLYDPVSQHFPGPIG